MRALMQFAYLVRRTLLGVLRIPTTGVKVMVFNPAGRVLLIRNSYGETGRFLLPGGGVGRREEPRDAAVREVREEVGIEIAAVELVGTFQSTAEGKRDTIHLFRATTAGDIAIDNLEVVEARFFAVDALPDTVSAATRRRIEEVSGSRQATGRW